MTNIEDAIQAFRNAAIAKGDVHPRRDGELHDEMRRALRRLDAAGSAGRAALTALAADASPHVRLWIATELLARGRHEMRAVVEQLAGSAGILGLNAATTLAELDGGRLKSPFPGVE